MDGSACKPQGCAEPYSPSYDEHFAGNCYVDVIYGFQGSFGAKANLRCCDPSAPLSQGTCL